MEFIELQNVNLTFKTKVQLIPIFKGLNLSIAKGEFLVIAGPSGRGKSTLLNLVSVSYTHLTLPTILLV